MAYEQFILGYIAGEGSFSLQVQASSDELDSTVGYYVLPMFQIAVNERERGTLDLIQDNIPVESTIYDETVNRDTSKLYFGGTDKVREFISWMEGVSNEAFENSAKYESMEKMKNITEKINRGEHLEKEGLIEIMEIRDSMNGKGHPNKKTADEIREEIL